jgi:FkbM family methyltransferase
MQWLASTLRKRKLDVAFNMLDIGALPVEGQEDPFQQLLKFFPSSRLSGIEIDPELFAELNRKASGGVRYYPHALGLKDEKRRLYEAMHPMCTSLYRFDERYADLFSGLDVMRLKHVSEIATISLDQLVRGHDLSAIDFIKIDVQGAELEVLQGGARALHDVLVVIAEVEFVPLYEGQPLFGDVSAHLARQGLSFHKFLGMAGWVIKPLTAHGHQNYPVQFLWADALFVKDLLKLDALDGVQLLKLAVLAGLYDSKDIALHALRQHDTAHGGDLAEAYLAHLNAGGPWKTAGGGESPGK